MIVLGTIQFEDEEIEVFERALQGHGRTIRLAPEITGRKDDYFPVRSHLSRIREHREPYDADGLEDLKRTLQTLINLWADQTSASAWRALGAPGSDEAVAGLALERTNAIGRVGEALRIVEEARSTLTTAFLGSGVRVRAGLRAREEDYERVPR